MAHVLRIRLSIVKKNKDMNSKTFTLLLFLFIGNYFVNAQEVSTLLNDPGRRFEAMHWHEDGRIYSIDYYNGRLYQIQLDGTVTTLLSGFTNLAGGGFGDDNFFYFSDIFSGSIHRLNEDGTETQIASGINQPVGVQASNDPDTLYVASYGSSAIYKVSISGGTATLWVSGNGLSGPDGMAIHESGDLLIANFNNNKIHRVTTSGEISLFATIPSTGFMGYMTRAGEYVYVPSIAGNRVYRVDMAGNVEVFAGTGSAGHADGVALEATFTDPNGITSNAAGDTILVADENYLRLITGFITVATEEAELLDLLEVYPNPVKDILQVKYRLKTTGTFNWEVINTQGIVQRQENVHAIAHQTDSLQMNVKGLAAGWYVLRCSNKNGEAQTYSFLKL